IIGSAGILLDGVPALSTDLLNALTLFTFGSQLRGSYHTVLGQESTRIVFQMIREVVKDAIIEESATHLLVRNAAGRLVRIEFAPDPDIAIREQLGPGRFNNRIAIDCVSPVRGADCVRAGGDAGNAAGIQADNNRSKTALVETIDRTANEQANALMAPPNIQGYA
ncbi:MAG: XcyI family restriction endonuclease, partial [Nitrososphaerales archaeon]